MTYIPMANDRRDFNPMGQEWGYVCDEHPGQDWRGMVPLNLRPFTWPYQLHTDRLGKDPYGSARLAPDCCFYAWRNEYVGASWNPQTPQAVDCATTLERRYAPAGEVSDWPANPFAGDGNDRWRVYEWRAEITLNLSLGAFLLDVTPRGKGGDRAPAVPVDVRAEAEHKAGKLLAFFREQCTHWRAGDQPRPVQAWKLAHPDD
jgi:hypothetical protein